ncbi:transglycosylase SLT domain-containing protein [Acinetobacter baumannii]
MSITWNRLADPDFHAGNALLMQGQQLWGQAIKDATQGATNFAVAQEKQNTGKLLDYISSAKNPAQYQSEEFQSGLNNLRQSLGKNFDAETVRAAMDGRVGKLQADALNAQKYTDTVNAVADRENLAKYYDYLRQGDFDSATKMRSQFQAFQPEYFTQGLGLYKDQHTMNNQDMELAMRADQNRLDWTKLAYAQANEDRDYSLKAYDTYSRGSGGGYELGADGSITQSSSGVGQFAPLINEASATYGLPANLLAGLVMGESSGNPNARSKAGAAGLTQLMPGTAKDLGVTNPNDPRQSILGGAKYLSQLVRKYGNADAALKAYNWGPGNYDAYLKTGKGMKGQPMPKETVEYASKVLGHAKNYGKSSDDSLNTKADRRYMVNTNVDKWEAQVKDWTKKRDELPQNTKSKYESLNDFKFNVGRGEDILIGIGQVKGAENLSPQAKLNLATKIDSFIASNKYSDRGLFDSGFWKTKSFGSTANPIDIAKAYTQSALKAQKTYDVAIPYNQDKAARLKRNSELVDELNSRASKR